MMQRRSPFSPKLSWLPRIRAWPVLCLGLGLASWTADARDVAGLYHVELPALEQSRASRERLTQAALRELLQRLTGRAGAAGENPVVEAAATQASSLVQAFGFREPSPEERAASGAQFVLQLDFDPGALQRLLKEAGLPVWGRERPETLLWLVLPAEPAMAEAPSSETAPADIVTAPHPGFLSPGDAPVLERQLQLAAQRRGLPLALPKDEPAERETLSLDALRMPVAESVEAVSLAYSADVLLAGELSRAGGGWTGRMHLLRGAELESWDVQAASESAALERILDGLGERLARRYALRQDAKAGALALRIGNVRNLADYAQLLRYLQSLSLVKRVAVREVRGYELRVELTTSADAAALSQLLALGQHLQVVTGAQDGLNYQWQP
ncbi:MAG: DUF2066 domain-containing protein [Gammaproteobacteria bacterium]|nr:DUF2066 domain-containing protein [Gammaproteobacteria bacterium]